MGKRVDEAVSKDLIARFKAGEVAAMGRLYELHIGGLCSFVGAFLRTDDPELVHDLSHQVWLNVLEGLPRFLNDSSFSTWLFGIAKNRCLDHRQAEKRERAAPPGPPPMPPSPGSLSHAERGAFMADLEKGLASLPPAEALVFRMARIEGLSFPEIARRTGVPESTLKKRMNRALEGLRTKLAGWAPEDEQEPRT